MNTSLVPLFLPFLHPQWRAPRRCGRWGGGCRALRVDWGKQWRCVTPRLRLVGCCDAPGALTTADHDCVVGWRGRAWCCRAAGCTCALSRRSTASGRTAACSAACTSARAPADQRARGPQRDGIARAAPNHQSEPPGRRRVGEKPTRLRENAWKFRGSSFPCQGNKHRLTGKTSEAVFVSFVWVN